MRLCTHHRSGALTSSLVVNYTPHLHRETGHIHLVLPTQDRNIICELYMSTDEAVQLGDDLIAKGKERDSITKLISAIEERLGGVART